MDVLGAPFPNGQQQENWRICAVKSAIPSTTPLVPETSGKRNDGV
jgi:hypothetical protein